MINSSNLSQTKEAASLYRPNFCSECGAKILRLHWRLWSSRRFCDDCAPRLRKQRWTTPLVTVVVLLCIGMIAGRAGRPAPPPLIIERPANSSLFNDDGDNDEESDSRSGHRENSPGEGNSSNSDQGDSSDDQQDSSGSESSAVEEMAYTCGARTKKGAPCSRRVYGPVRCWQHKGKRAMLPLEKLILRE